MIYHVFHWKLSPHAAGGCGNRGPASIGEEYLINT